MMSNNFCLINRKKANNQKLHNSSRQRGYLALKEKHLILAKIFIFHEQKLHKCYQSTSATDKLLKKDEWQESLRLVHRKLKWKNVQELLFFLTTLSHRLSKTPKYSNYYEIKHKEISKSTNRRRANQICLHTKQLKWLIHYQKSCR